MAITYVKIGTTLTVGAGGTASVGFTSIPTDYTDLVILASLRGTQASSWIQHTIRFNTSTTTFTGRVIQGDGSTAGSNTNGGGFLGLGVGGTNTASTFNNIEIYVPNYAASINKAFSSMGVTESNIGGSYLNLHAMLWSTTSAINSFSIYPDVGNIAEYSTVSLYGIKKF